MADQLEKLLALVPADVLLGSAQKELKNRADERRLELRTAIERVDNHNKIWNSTDAALIAYAREQAVALTQAALAFENANATLKSLSAPSDRERDGQ